MRKGRPNPIARPISAAQTPRRGSGLAGVVGLTIEELIPFLTEPKFQATITHGYQRDPSARAGASTDSSESAQAGGCHRGRRAGRTSVSRYAPQALHRALYS